MPKAVMTITLEDDGRVSVEGPISDRILAYGLLGSARDCIEQFAREHERRVQPALSLPGMPGARRLTG